MSGRHRAEDRPPGYWEAIERDVAEAPPMSAEQARNLRALLSGFAESARQEQALAESRVDR
jgi:hypothetical protein